MHSNSHDERLLELEDIYGASRPPASTLYAVSSINTATKEAGEDLVEPGSSPPPGPAPTGPKKRRPKRRCTCALHGVCDVCREIVERRLAAELRRRAGDNDG